MQSALHFPLVPAPSRALLQAHPKPNLPAHPTRDFAGNFAPPPPPAARTPPGTPPSTLPYLCASGQFYGQPRVHSCAHPYPKGALHLGTRLYHQKGRQKCLKMFFGASCMCAQLNGTLLLVTIIYVSCSVACQEKNVGGANGRMWWCGASHNLHLPGCKTNKSTLFDKENTVTFC